MKKAFIYVCSVLFVSGCEEENFTICTTGNCESWITIPNATQDSNGYYHLTFNWNGSSYPYFALYVEASKLIERCQYNHISVVEATFDTNTYWVIGDSLAFIIPLYNKFTSLYSSPYWTKPISIGTDTVILNQYSGLLVPIVQKDTRIYLREYFPGNDYQKPDEYKPSDPDKFLWSKRIAGPISPTLRGDTASIFMKVGWDCGGNSIDKDNYIIRIIFD